MTQDNPSPSPSPRHSRRWTLALLGLGAAAIGAGVGWRRLALDTPDDDGIWQHRFTNLDNHVVALADMKGSPLLLNFWATWCPPCVEEMPMLSAFYEQAQAHGWQMLGLAIDQVDPVKTFLRKRPVSYPIAIAGFAGVDLTKQLGNTQGGLPFTVVFGADGSIQHRKLGQLKQADLDHWLA